MYSESLSELEKHNDNRSSRVVGICSKSRETEGRVKYKGKVWGVVKCPYTSK